MQTDFEVSNDAFTLFEDDSQLALINKPLRSKLLGYKANKLNTKLVFRRNHRCILKLLDNRKLSSNKNKPDVGKCSPAFVEEIFTRIHMQSNLFKSLIGILILAIKMGLIAYTIDVILFYDNYWLVKLIPLCILAFLVSCAYFIVNLISYSSLSRLAPFALLLIVAIGVYIKMTTQGDPTFKFVAKKLNGYLNALYFILAFGSIVITEKMSFNWLGMIPPKSKTELAEEILDNDL